MVVLIQDFYEIFAKCPAAGSSCILLNGIVVHSAKWDCRQVFNSGKVENIYLNIPHQISAIPEGYYK